jgi:hypothetical protein
MLLVFEARLALSTTHAEMDFICVPANGWCRESWLSSTRRITFISENDRKRNEGGRENKMSEITIAALIFSGVGAVFIGLGIPLFQRRVPPNSWYGCRTTKSLSDEGIWYAVNRTTGQDMILAGILIIISSLIVFMFRNQMNPNSAAVALPAVLIMSTTGMAVNSLRVLRRM